MKKLILAAAVSATALGAVPALAWQTGMGNTVRTEVQALVPNADLSSLSPTQEARIAEIVMNGSGDYSNKIDRRNAVTNILNER